MDETVVNSICQSIISVAHSELDYVSGVLSLSDIVVRSQFNVCWRFFRLSLRKVSLPLLSRC